MEVNVDRNTTFGARLHGGETVPDPSSSGTGRLPVIAGTKFGSESLPPSFSIASLASFGGFLAGIQGPAIPALDQLGISIPAFGLVLHALTVSSDVNVLSTPHILTMDNQEAEISVGQNVPFQAGILPGALNSLGALGSTPTAGTTASLGGALGLTGLTGLGGLVAPINRQNVELKLTVKPQINESDYIRLTINEQTEEIASTDPVLGPTTSKRQAKTTVVARDQETVVIGGIMQDRTIQGVNKVPLLGDIPLIGHLFREENNRKVKTNLLLFLTPYIIKDQSDFRRIFERKFRERQEFVEAFYGQVPGYEAAVDFGRKRGPLSEVDKVLRKELMKVQNGGPGLPGEKVLTPAGPTVIVQPPAGSVQPGLGGPQANPPAAQPPQPAQPAPGPAGVQPPETGAPAAPEGQPAREGTPPAEGSTGSPPPSEEIQIQ
jgi:general secretion pathway protein D